MFDIFRTVRTLAKGDSNLTTTVKVAGAQIKLLGMPDTYTDAGFIVLASEQPTLGDTGKLDTKLQLPKEGDGVLVGKSVWANPPKAHVVTILETASGLSMQEETPKPRKGRKSQGLDMDAVAAGELAQQEAAV